MKNEYRLIETHAHYDHPLFEGKGAEIVRDLFDKNVIGGVVIPGLTYESNFFDRETFPKGVYFAPGLHPKCATNEAWWKSEKRSAFEAILTAPKTVAIKTGLDFSKTKLSETQKNHQIRFFEYMIDLANDIGLPLILHIRDATMEAIEVVRENPLKVEAVVHCFSYDIAIAQKMMNVGITRFGIGGMLTRDNMGPLRACVQELPLSTILLETDAPFVKPKGFRGNINTSKSLFGTARLIAELKGLTVDEVIQAAQRNAREFYGL